MKTNTSSLILKVRILGLISALVLIAFILAIVVVLIFNDKRLVTLKSIETYKALKENRLNKTYLKEHQLQQVKSCQKIKEKGKFVLYNIAFREAFYSANIELYTYKKHYYYLYNLPHQQLCLKDINKNSSYIFLIIIALSFMGVGLYFLQRYITRALENINELQNAQTLFLRNIMHEFKTPLTRATLSVHSLDDKLAQKKVLLNQCSTLNEHFAKLQHIESLKSLQMKPTEYALIDFIDEIQDYLESENITHNITSEMLHVDYEYFYIALKNLIDNALKYSSDNSVIIRIKNNKLFIYNRSTPPKKAFKHYLSAFERGERNTVSGMGLGLYISNEVFIKHKVRMKNYYIKPLFYIILDLKNVINSL